MHIINNVLLPPNHSTSLAMFMAEVTDKPSTSQEQISISYEDVPRLPKAKQSDDRILLIPNWIITLSRPPQMSDDEYTTFIHYALQFFIQADKLW